MSRYILYDADERRYMAWYRRPVKGVDAVVTGWTDNPERAMRFRSFAAARSAMAWTGRGDFRIIDVEDRKVMD